MVGIKDSTLEDLLGSLSREQDCFSPRGAARSPNLNSFSERWVKSVKDDCLSKLILFGETSLRRALHDYLMHYHANEIIRVKATYCYFQPPRKQRIVLTDQLSVKNAWVGC